MTLYCDLDGVLADFNSKVFEIFGKVVEDLDPYPMWAKLSKTPNFFTDLPWTKEGKELWSAIKDVKPIILTGVPRGGWAEQQKVKWCRSNLGSDVKVITCWSYEKYKYCREGDIIIDDRIQAKDSWESVGGIFLHHKNIGNTINEMETILRR